MSRYEYDHDLYLTPTPFPDSVKESRDFFTHFNQLVTGMLAEKIKDGKLSDESAYLAKNLYTDEDTKSFFKLAYTELKSADVTNFQVMKNMVECGKLFVGHLAPARSLTEQLVYKGKIVNWPLLFQLLKNKNYDFASSDLNKYFLDNAKKVSRDYPNQNEFSNSNNK